MQIPIDNEAYAFPICFLLLDELNKLLRLGFLLLKARFGLERSGFLDFANRRGCGQQGVS